LIKRLKKIQQINANLLGINFIMLWSFCVFYLIFSTSLWAETFGETKVITVIGTSKITKDDVVSARDQAILNGQISALSSVVFKILPQDVLLENFQFLNESLYLYKDKAIQGYKVLAETSFKKQYRIVMQVTVLPDNIRETVANFTVAVREKPLPKILICVSEQDIESPIVQYWWRNGLVENKTLADQTIFKVLSERGFDIIDQDIRISGIVLEAVKDLPNINRRAAVNLGRQLNAEVVIVGQSSVEAIRSHIEDEAEVYKGILRARAFRVDNGEEIASTNRTFANLKVDEMSGLSSISDAIIGASKIAGENLASQIITSYQHKEQLTIPLEVEVTGTDDLTCFIEFRRFLKGIDGMKSFQIKEINADNATLVVEYMGDTDALAKALMAKTFSSLDIIINEVTPMRLKLGLVKREIL